METAQNPLAITGGKQVLDIPMEQICSDPAQPRKTLDDIQDMANSIKGAGGRILQPIALKPIEKGYQIIFGERRYQGARLLAMKTIPAIIYENVTNGEALEMQIVENLQRRDLHPMQQAIGFKRLAEDRSMDVREISVRVGKSEYFVRQQLKLNELIPDWQVIFLKNGISVTVALKICVLPPEIQKSIYDSHVSKEDEKCEQPQIDINEYLFHRYKGDLFNACFDTNDGELDKKSGPCTSCPFNSSLNSLFPEQEKHPRCHNISCYNNKIQIHMKREIEKVKQDPTLVVVYDSYSMPDMVKKLKEEGVEVYKIGHGDECKFVLEPTKPVWEVFEQQQKKLNKSIAKIKPEFKKEEETYAFRKEVFEKNVQAGKFRKAFVAYASNDTNVGKYLYIELTPKKSTKPVKKTFTDGKVSVEDLDQEITRLETRQRRGKELDQEKVYKRITETIRSEKVLEKIPQKVSPTDTALVNFLLIQSLNWSNREKARKLIKSADLWYPKDKEKFHKALISLSKNQIAYLVRQITMQNHSFNLPTSAGGLAVRLMAEGLGTIPIQQYESEQNAIAEKRTANSNRAIGTLKEMKKETIAAAKIPVKKTITKKTPQIIAKRKTNKVA